MGLAQQAAFLYWYTGEEKYARFAYDLLDTYLTGIAYRKEPIDLSHSHIQTLVGLTSFEVIHEDVLFDVIAVVLDDDKTYANGHGNHYYLDQILNQTSTRQWGLTELIRKGFDAQSGLWSECPGYSVNVVKDFTDFVK
nr:hypothetical protein [Tanacetum cinerariifolium]